MTFDVSALSTQSPAPTMQADLRPSADIAALARDPQPNVPMPVPASMLQSGAVTQSKLGSSTELQALEKVSAAERVLKPYGVAMLPESAHEAEAQTLDEDNDDSPTTREATDSKSDEDRLGERQSEPDSERSNGPESGEPVGRNSDSGTT